MFEIGRLIIIRWLDEDTGMTSITIEEDPAEKTLDSAIVMLTLAMDAVLNGPYE